MGYSTQQTALSRTRMSAISKRVAFVSTGDEIINGETLNTNAPYFAEQLFEANMTPGYQLTVADNLHDIEQAIRYVLQDHSAVITIGGLGPTSDDRTRFALSAAIERPLQFNEQVWQWIIDLFIEKGLGTPPETNRQQALLPEGATAIPNANGSAAACYISHHDQDIFMLPGPPNECFPIFHQAVLPHLHKKNYARTHYRHHWLLLGASEGAIASKIENLVPPQCTLGYRVHYPYLTVKLHSDDLTAFKKSSLQLTTFFQPFLISESTQTASEQLLQCLNKTDKNILITDNATYGLLESALFQPTTRDRVQFYRKKLKRPKPMLITISGLKEYWKKSTDQTLRMPLTIHITTEDKIHTIEKHIANHGSQSLQHAVEVICWELLHYLHTP